MKTCKQKCNLKQLVKRPTNKHNRILDWIIVKDDDELVRNIDVVDNMAKPKAIRRHVKSHDFIKLHFYCDTFCSDITSRSLPLSDDVDILTSQFNKDLSDTHDKHAPKSCRKPAPWMNVVLNQMSTSCLL